MTLFIDASAFVAIIAGEDERDSLANRIARDGDPIWSPLACWETVSSLRRSHRFEIDVARAAFEQVTTLMGARLVGVGEAELAIALDAYKTYGRGQNHPAKLNFGDCFAYACAKANQANLLYEGEDFTHTDLAWRDDG